MKESLISLKTAILAKETGFDEECEWVIYNPSKSTENEPYRCGKRKYNFYSRPPKDGRTRVHICTQSLLQKWLREKFNIIVEVVEYYTEEDLPLSDLKFPTPKGWYYWDKYDDDFSEEKAEKFAFYEQALDYGLQKALNLVLVWKNKYTKS